MVSASALIGFLFHIVHSMAALFMEMFLVFSNMSSLIMRYSFLILLSCACALYGYGGTTLSYAILCLCGGTDEINYLRSHL